MRKRQDLFQVKSRAYDVRDTSARTSARMSLFRWSTPRQLWYTIKHLDAGECIDPCTALRGYGDESCFTPVPLDSDSVAAVSAACAATRACSRFRRGAAQRDMPLHARSTRAAAPKRHLGAPNARPFVALLLRAECHGLGVRRRGSVCEWDERTNTCATRERNAESVFKNRTENGAGITHAGSHRASPPPMPAAPRSAQRRRPSWRPRRGAAGGGTAARRRRKCRGGRRRRPRRWG